MGRTPTGLSLIELTFSNCSFLATTAVELGRLAYHLLDAVDTGFSQVAAGLNQILFFSIGGFPLIVLWLAVAALFFTLRLRLISVRTVSHAIAVLRGRYDNPDEAGEVSHFQAVATALSATVGLGNIAGVAIAISLGGPGAVCWMTLGGILGMSSKFVECTLAQKYRTLRPDGTVAGGPMYYLADGMAAKGYPRFGLLLAGLFAVLGIGGSLSGISMFQASQSYSAIATVLPNLPDWGYGIGFMALAALVVLGGIERIGQVAATLIPSLCTLYVAIALWVLLVHVTEIPAAIQTIIHGALSPTAIEGGIIGVMVQGLRWSVFSSAAGVGSAAIAHAASRTEEPIREGIVAMIEPFIDTVIICNMTALVIVITGVYAEPDLASLQGAELTAAAFASVVDWFAVVLAIAVFFFAFSTVISWGYYGEQAWSYLFRDRGIFIYKLLFLAAIVLGTIGNPAAVVDLGNGLLLAMAFPNLLGAYFLLDQVVADLQDYLDRLRQGKFEPTQTVPPSS